MPEGDTTASANVEVIPATLEQASILANLIELYAHDFSEFHHIEIGEDGRFGYPPLPLYWSDPHRHPFLIRLDGKLAGLALVKKGPSAAGTGAVWDMAEFFVIRGCRRHGAGTRAAHQVWRRFPGPWEVRVMQSNVAALRFWEGAISMFMAQAIRPALIAKDGVWWSVFSFESEGAA